jgi:hypothetical protein
MTERLRTVEPLETPVRWWIGDGSVSRREAARACRRQALLLWPRLDPQRLARTRGDPWRIARLVARRTPRSLDEIVAMLTSSAPACPIVPARSRRDAPGPPGAGGTWRRTAEPGPPAVALMELS